MQALFSVNHHLFKQLFGKTTAKSNGRAAVIASLRTTFDRSNHLNVMMNNALTELDNCQSPSSIDSSSLPPPMYQAVYAEDQFMLNNSDEQPTTSINCLNNDALLLMECASSYCAAENHQRNNRTIENLPSGTILNYTTSCTTGSISWSQAETLPLGINSHCGESLHHEFISPTSPISTISVSFPNQQLRTISTIDQTEILITNQTNQETILLEDESNLLNKPAEVMASTTSV